MRREGDLVIFDNLVRPSEELVGETKPVRARVPRFTAPNAKGELREVANFEEVGQIAKAAGKSFRRAFSS